MGVTANIKKLRAAASTTVKLGQWHEDFNKVKKFADSKNVPLFAVWSNGDASGHCIAFEQCLLDNKFKTWQKTCECALWIGLGSDTSAADKRGGTGYNFAWGAKKALKLFPFVRLYWKQGKVDICKTGDDWTGGTGNSKGATKLVKALQAALKNYCPSCEPQPTPEPEPASGNGKYKVRLNEAMTVAQINTVLDAIDANDGYCPCQVGKTADTKCNCKDFKENKEIGEPCICKIYVKQKADKAQIAKGNSRRVATKTKGTNKKRR